MSASSGVLRVMPGWAGSSPTPWVKGRADDGRRRCARSGGVGRRRRYRTSTGFRPRMRPGRRVAEIDHQMVAAAPLRWRGSTVQGRTGSPREPAACRSGVTNLFTAPRILVCGSNLADLGCFGQSWPIWGRRDRSRLVTACARMSLRRRAISASHTPLRARILKKWSGAASNRRHHDVQVRRITRTGRKG